MYIIIKHLKKDWKIGIKFSIKYLKEIDDSRSNKITNKFKKEVSNINIHVDIIIKKYSLEDIKTWYKIKKISIILINNIIIKTCKYKIIINYNR
jgi:hypothetical protein